MPKNIILSPKYGLNSSVAVCFYCNEEKNEIIIPGKLKGDKEAPRKAVWDYEPCNKCKDFMQQGIILISTKASEKESDNPYRTGGWVVVKEEFIKRNIEFISANQILKRRMAFVPDDAWDKLHLPRAN